MDLAELIKHPELLDKETLYDLRSLLALYPYYQTARLLLLQNLYLLHDPSFDEELRRSAIYISDRKVLFNLVEAAHYKTCSCKQKPRKLLPRLMPMAIEQSRSSTTSSILFLPTRKRTKLLSANLLLPMPPSTMCRICLKQSRRAMAIANSRHSLRDMI